jgi:hypothetical protein
VNALAFLAADVENGMFQRFFAATDIPVDAVLSSLPAGRMLAPVELCAAVRAVIKAFERTAVADTPQIPGGAHRRRRVPLRGSRASPH